MGELSREQRGSEGTCRDHLVRAAVGKEPGREELASHPVRRSGDGDSAASPGRLFQRLMVLAVEVLPYIEMKSPLHIDTHTHVQTSERAAPGPSAQDGRGLLEPQE